MFEFILSIHIALSMSLFFSYSPLILALLIVILSLIQGTFCFLILSKWVGISMVLVFVGGMMVSFMYVASLSANNKLVLNKKLTMSLMSMVFLSPLIFNFLLISFPSLPSSPTSMFLSQNFHLLVFLVSFLLCSLFVVSKITENFKGSLMEKF